MKSLLLAVAAALTLSACAELKNSFVATTLPDPQIGMSAVEVNNSTWVGKSVNIKFHTTQTGDDLHVQMVLPCGKCYSYSSNGMNTWYLYFEGSKSQGAESLHLVSIQN